jgi:hypothetical protein
VYRLNLQAQHGYSWDDKRGVDSRTPKINMKLSTDEYIKKVTVTWNEYVCSLTFASASRVFGPYSSSNLNCLAPSVILNATVTMGRLLYITGRCGHWLDAIGFAYTV